MTFKTILNVIFIIIFWNIVWFSGFYFFIGAIPEISKLMWSGTLLGNIQVLFGFIAHFGFKNINGVKSSDQFD